MLSLKTKFVAVLLAGASVFGMAQAVNASTTFGAYETTRGVCPVPSVGFCQGVNATNTAASATALVQAGVRSGDVVYNIIYAYNQWTNAIYASNYIVTVGATGSGNMPVSVYAGAGYQPCQTYWAIGYLYDYTQARYIASQVATSC